MKSKSFCGAVFVLILVFSISSSLVAAASNESVEAKESLAQAEFDIVEMVGKSIPVNRVNETYQEASQLYLAQKSLEDRGGNAKYNLIIDYALDISSVKEVSLEANDELKIFIETFEDASLGADLSEMQEDYDVILLSFQEERFEDTLELVEGGYERISDIQSSQTATRLFYSSVSGGVKDFFVNNWLTIIIVLAAAFVLFLIFRKSLREIMIRRKFNHLNAQKKAISGLMKKSQKGYFKTRKVSGAEYNIKLKRFKEMLRDIDRQLMVLKEEKFKVGRKKEKK